MGFAPAGAPQEAIRHQIITLPRTRVASVRPRLNCEGREMSAFETLFWRFG